MKHVYILEAGNGHKKIGIYLLEKMIDELVSENRRLKNERE
jgi:hypothetical protein